MKRRVVDTNIEQNILTWMITSTEYLREVYPLFHREFIKSDFARTVALWTTEYFKKYRNSPESDIKNLYTYHAPELKEEDAVIVQEFLKNISTRYEDQDSAAQPIVNVQYCIDSTIKYFTERSLELLAEYIQGCIASGDIDKAQKRIREFTTVSKQLSEWKNPFDDAIIEDVFKKVFEGGDEQRADNLFKLPGAVGELIGYLRRNWFVAIEAPYKRGKSWAQELFGLCALMHRCRVVIVSLEMSHEEEISREYMMITGQKNEEGNFLFPIFDCEKNQVGSCHKKERTNLIQLRRSIDLPVPEYDDAPKGYKACIACKAINKDFELTAWWEVIYKDRLTLPVLKKKIKAFKKAFGDNLRVLSYPAMSANIMTLKDDLERLEYDEGFIPDVIIIDYLDILSPEKGSDDNYRHRLDETWKMAKNLAAEKHCLVVSATQVNDKGAKKRHIDSSDSAEDKRKQGHVDEMYALNQLEEEKDLGIMRFTKTLSRHRKFDKKKEAIVLQNLELGQVIVDSTF